MKVLKDEICKFKVRFRTYTIRASIKTQISIFEKIMMRKSNVKLARFTFFLNEHRERNILFLILFINLLLTIEKDFLKQFKYLNKLFKKILINEIVFESQVICFV